MLNKDLEGLRIGQVAELAGASVDTLRFYEKEGLIPKPPRTSSGYRVYPHGLVDRVRFIRRAKVLGFSLSDIRELVSFRDRGAQGTCGGVRALALRKMKDVDMRMRELEAIRRSLEQVVSDCSGHEPIQECRILATMEGSP